MLQSVRNLLGFRVAAKDGNIGRVTDLLLDDRSWEMRYLVVDTGNWLPGRRVLIFPEALGQPSYPSRAFPVDLTTELIESSPPLDKGRPVSERYAARLREHYATSGSGAGVPGIYESTEVAGDGGSHLRSTNEALGYAIAASDGRIGRLEDFLVDDETWAFRYFVVDTKNWLRGKYALLSCKRIRAIDWHRGEVGIDLPRERIENDPDFDFAAPVLYDDSGRPTYWTGRQ